MQAPDQCSLPRDSVKRSFDLPPVTDENTRSQCYHAAREAIMEITHRRPGPASAEYPHSGCTTREIY